MVRDNIISRVTPLSIFDLAPLKRLRKYLRSLLVARFICHDLSGKLVARAKEIGRVI